MVNERDVNDLLMCIANYVLAEDVEGLKGALDDIDNNIETEVEIIKGYCSALLDSNMSAKYCLDRISFFVKSCYDFLEGKEELKEFIKKLEMEELDNGFNI